MKILWLSHLIPYPPKGGVLQRSYHLLNELSKNNSIDLLAFQQTNLMKPVYPDISEGLKISKSVLSGICNYVEFFSIPSLSSNSQALLALKSLFTKDPYNINWLKSQEYGAAVEKALKENDYDLVHLDTISLIPYFKLVPENIPIALDHHNIESHMLFRRAENEINPIKKLYFWQEGKRLEKFEKIYCPKCAVNITCSDLDTHRLKKIVNSENIETIPNGVDISFFSPNLFDVDVLEKGIKRLVFIGRLSWYPNTKAVSFLANKLWPKLKLAIPEIECDIIGANPPNDVLKLSNQDRTFRVHGFVDDIHPFFTTTSIYICPITDGGGTKLKIIDALAMGMPIVADPIACEGISVENNVNIIFAETEEEYVSNIKSLFDSTDSMRKLGEKARELAVKSYSYESIGAHLEEIYKKL